MNHRTLAAATALTLGVLSAMPAQTVPTAEYPRQFGYLTMKDGVRLAYTVYLPQATGRFPAVLQYEPYVGAGSGPDGAGPNSKWLQSGYAVVFANVRGTGCSQGVADTFGPHEGPDGAEIVAWIGRQPWSDQNVGMIGGSYPGHTQVIVAAEHPPFLKAIAPSAITASIYDEAIYPGGIFNLTFVSRWSLMHQPGAEQFGVKARIGWGDRECAANQAAHPKSRLMETMRAHPLFDAWWRQRSLVSLVDRVKVPAYVSGTWQDHQTSVTGGLAIYGWLTGPKRIALSPGGHGQVYFQAAFQDDMVRWMDRWLKGVENGIDTEPPVTVYWELGAGGTPGPNWTSRHAAWPPPEVKRKTFYLTGDATLASTPAADSSTAATPRSYTYPVGTELIGSSAQFALAPDPTGSLIWVTPPLDQDLAILGGVEVVLHLASDRVDTDLMLDLHDVYPNGDVQFLQRGLLRASLRRVDPARSSPDRAWRSYDRTVPLEPGRVTEIRLTLPQLGAVVRSGHRLQLALMAPSSIGQPDWGPLPLALPGRNTVYGSLRYPSQIRVPVLEGVRAGGPEPACGSLPFQPCRPASPSRGR